MDKLKQMIKTQRLKSSEKIIIDILTKEIAIKFEVQNP